MTTVTMPAPGRRDWVLANPWFWIALGLAASALAWLGLILLEDTWPALRFGLVITALLAAGTALALRLDFTQPAFFARLGASQRSLILLVMAGLFALMALGVSVLLVLSFVGTLRHGWGQLLLWWIVVAPMGTAAATQCLRRLRAQEPLQEREEGAALLLLTALVCFGCWWALYEPADPLFLDTIRLFLSVAMLVALVAAPLVLVRQSMRRGVISLLILLHFGGILTAAFTAPPTPTALSQLWNRIYRPYLEFTYLINAYHFYAPEPGPSSYLWFRIFFEDSQSRTVAQWVKVPDMSEQSRHGHPTSLSYQRHLALTENTVATDPAPNFYEMAPDGSLAPAPFYYRRVLHSQPFKDQIVGVAIPKTSMVIPFHADVIQQQQYQPPSAVVKRLLSSYTRHVAHEARRDGMRVKSIKLYRVIHLLPPTQAFISGVSEPTDPDTYRPIYLGEYDTDGTLQDPEEPFLYWMLPNVKAEPYSRTSRYFSHARKHAGDPNWIRNEEKKWVDN